jgi:hypothetical protein
MFAFNLILLIHQHFFFCGSCLHVKTLHALFHVSMNIWRYFHFLLSICLLISSWEHIFKLRTIFFLSWLRYSLCVVSIRKADHLFSVFYFIARRLKPTAYSGIHTGPCQEGISTPLKVLKRKHGSKFLGWCPDSSSYRLRSSPFL